MTGLSCKAAALNRPSRQPLLTWTLQNGFSGPDNAVLGLVGDFDSESVKLLVSDVFNDWEPQFGEPPVPPSLPM